MSHPRDPGLLRNAQGERLDATFVPSASPAAAARPLVLVAHGVTSHKERPWLVTLCACLATAGFDALRFTFAGNEGSEGRFVDATIQKEVGDLGSVIDACAGRPVVYCGHSMGAAVGLLRTLRDPRIVALVSLAGVIDPAGLISRVFGHLRPGEPMLDKPNCPFSAALRDGANALGSLLPRAREVTVPWLLVHGDQDELVPHAESAAAAAAAPRASLVTLPGVDHRFAGAHDAMAAAVVRWLLGLRPPGPGAAA